MPLLAASNPHGEALAKLMGSSWLRLQTFQILRWDFKRNRLPYCIQTQQNRPVPINLLAEPFPSLQWAGLNPYPETVANTRKDDRFEITAKGCSDLAELLLKQLLIFHS